MSEQNANMTLSDTPEKIFSGEVSKTDFQQESHESYESYEELETNEKGVDEIIKSET